MKGKRMKVKMIDKFVGNLKTLEITPEDALKLEEGLYYGNATMFVVIDSEMFVLTPVTPEELFKK